MENREITMADYIVEKLANEVKELKIALAKTEFSAMAYKEKAETLQKELDGLKAESEVEDNEENLGA